MTDEERRQLLEFIYNEKMSIVDAAKIVNIPYENAKVINQLFIKEGRVCRKYKLSQESAQTLNLNV